MSDLANFKVMLRRAGVAYTEDILPQGNEVCISYGERLEVWFSFRLDTGAAYKNDIRCDTCGEYQWSASESLNIEDSEVIK